MYEEPAYRTKAPFSATGASIVEARWRTSQTPFSSSDHFYLQINDIDPAPLDIRLDDEEKQLLVPMFTNDCHGLADLMLIGQDGQLSQLNQDGAGYSRITGKGEGRIFCVDYASGYTLWRATGRTVIVCWEPEWLGTITEMFPRHPNDCIALDSATQKRINFTDAWRIGASVSSIKYAMTTNLPFYLPSPARSFCSLGIQGTERILSHPPVSQAPAFRPNELDQIELSGGQKNWFKELSDATDPKTAASLAFSIVKRLLPSVPVRMSL